MIITDTGIIVSLAPPTPAPTHTQTNHKPPCLICLTWIFKSFTCIYRVLKKTFIMNNKINTIFHQITKYLHHPSAWFDVGEKPRRLPPFPCYWCGSSLYQWQSCGGKKSYLLLWITIFSRKIHSLINQQNTPMNTYLQSTLLGLGILKHKNSIPLYFKYMLSIYFSR